jgi:hypothetical protein
MIKLYYGSSLIKYIVGEGTDTDTFICSEEPTEVRYFNSEHPNGVLITKNTDATLDIDEWEWNNDTDSVVLGASNENKMIAIKGEVFLSEGNKIPVVGTEEERSYTNTIKVLNESTTLKALDIYLTPSVLFPNDDIETSWVEFSSDNITFDDELNISEILPEEFDTIYVKITVPDESEIMVFRNIGINATYIYEYDEEV